MKARLLLAVLIFAALDLKQNVACAQITTSSQQQQAGEVTTSSCAPLAGIVIESVEKSSGGEQAGIQEGDVLLRWSRVDMHGDLGSPFDLTNAETEQGPRGLVTLEGTRGEQSKTWALNQSRWHIKARPNLSRCLLPMYLDGQDLARSGKFVDAAKQWKTATAISQKLGTPWLPVWLEFHAGLALADARQWQEADNAYQDAVQMAAAATPLVRAQILRAWAGTYRQRSDWANAEKYYLQALVEYQKAGAETLMIAADLNDLGVLARRQGDLSKAEEYYTKALAIREKLAPDSLEVAESLGNLGNIAGMRGELSKAEKYLVPALLIREKLAPNSMDVATGLNNLGNLAGLREDLAKAEDYHRRALVIREKLAPNSMDVAASWSNLGLVASNRGDLARADDYFHQSLVIREKLAPNGMDVANSLSNLGNVAEMRDDLAKAEEYHQQALAIYKKLAPDSMEVAFSLNNLGSVAYERSDLVKAAEYIQQALSIQTKLAPDSLFVALSSNDLGLVARARGNLAEAEQYLRQALAIRGKLEPESVDHAESLAALAGILRSQSPDEAAQLYEQALNALDGQMAHLGGSEDVRSAFRAKHSNYYADYIDLLISQKRDESAFQVLERSRARTLLEMLTAAHVDIRQGADPALLEREQILLEALKTRSDRRVQILSGQHTDEQAAAINKEISDLLSEYQELEGQIRESSPAYAALTQPQPLGAKQVQQMLDSETLLLEYSLGEEHSHVWVVTPTAVASYELPKRLEIDAAVRRVHDLLTARNLRTKGESEQQRDQRLAQAEKEYPRAAETLSRMLLGPVASQLGQKRLVIVSDGAVQYIPFSLLPLPSTRDTARHAGNKQPTLLMAEHEIVNLPSASVLALLRQQSLGRQIAAKAVAVLADPVFDDQDTRISAAKSPEQSDIASTSSSDALHSTEQITRSAADVGLASNRELHLSRLPFSRREAKGILSVIPAGQGMAALDFDANKATATSPNLAQYRIVHFATHGLLDSQHPELSGLVLSLVDRDGKRQNGFLQLQDIYNLNLPADMVVLSACDSGLGKEISGEGLVGLTRGFMYAGASRVVASLWNVDDVATAELMSRFYKSMFQDHLTPAAALRKAQLEMAQQKRWTDPYYWAAFEILGEWKAMQ